MQANVDNLLKGDTISDICTNSTTRIELKKKKRKE